MPIPALAPNKPVQFKPLQPAMLGDQPKVFLLAEG